MCELSIAFLSGRYDHPIRRMAQRVAVSNARDKAPKTKTVRLRIDPETYGLIVNGNQHRIGFGKTAKLVYVLSDGKQYTKRQIAEIAGIAVASVGDRLRNGCRDVNIVLRKKDDAEKKYALSDGKQYTAKEIAAIVGISLDSAYQRVRNGCVDVEKVLRKRDESKVTNLGK